MTNAEKTTLTMLEMLKIRREAESAYKALQAKVSFKISEVDFNLGFHEAAKKYLRQLETKK